MTDNEQLATDGNRNAAACEHNRQRGGAVKYDEACEKFSGDVCWIAARWLPIKQMFICDAPSTLGGDVDLEYAYRRVCELKEKIEGIRAERASIIREQEIA